MWKIVSGSRVIREKGLPTSVLQLTERVSSHLEHLSGALKLAGSDGRVLCTDDDVREYFSTMQNCVPHIRVECVLNSNSSEEQLNERRNGNASLLRRMTAANSNSNTKKGCFSSSHSFNTQTGEILNSQYNSSSSSLMMTMHEEEPSIFNKKSPFHDDIEEDGLNVNTTTGHHQYSSTNNESADWCFFWLGGERFYGVEEFADAVLARATMTGGQLEEDEELFDENARDIAVHHFRGLWIPRHSTQSIKKALQQRGFPVLESSSAEGFLIFLQGMLRVFLPVGGYFTLGALANYMEAELLMFLLLHPYVMAFSGVVVFFMFLRWYSNTRNRSVPAEGAGYFMMTEDNEYEINSSNSSSSFGGKLVRLQWHSLVSEQSNCPSSSSDEELTESVKHHKDIDDRQTNS